MAERIVTLIQPRHAQLPSRPKLLRVAAYARVSTSSDEQLNSVEAQKEYFAKLIKCNNEWMFAGIFADEGITGTSLQRRVAFNKMIDEAIAGNIDMIITKSLSRFARNTVDALNAIRLLKSHGVAVYFQRENINTLTSEGEFLITLMASLAEEESRSISENVKWGIRKRFSEGKYGMNYSTFLGYRKGPDGRPEIVESEADTVRLIYRMFFNGYSTNMIAAILTEKGITTPLNKDVWPRQTIESILTNEKYIGDARLQKTYSVDYRTKIQKKNEGELPMYYVEDGHPAIVSKELQAEICLRLNQRSNSRNSGKLFSKILYCADCGSAFTPKKWHSTSYNNIVWECEKNFKKRRTCKTTHLYEELLKPIFHNTILQLLRQHPDIMEIILKYINLPADEVWTTLECADLNREAEKLIWWSLIDKTNVFTNGYLEFHIIDGTVLPYQMENTTPRLQRLSMEMRAKIAEEHAAGISSKEIASKYGIPVGTIRSLTCRYQRRTRK